MADARIDFDAKTNAEYILTLRDLTDRGGDEFGYRLSIRPPAAAAKARFTARFTPDTIRVNRGGRSRIRCEVTPTAGFTGPVRLALELPAGLFSEPLIIEAGAPASGLMVISAQRDAVLGNFPIKLTATGMAGGKTVTRTAEPLLGDKPVREAFLTVLDSAPFTLDLTTLSATVEQKQSVELEVLARLREDFAGDIKLSMEGFSAGKEPITKSFDIKEATLKAGAVTGKVSLTAKFNSEVGTRTVMIKGDSMVDGQPTTQYTGTMPLTTVQIPFVVSSTLVRLSVTALPTNSNPAAAEASTIVKVDRRAGFTNEVLLALEGFPAGVNATLDTIAANTSETTLKLVATEKAPIGTNTFTLLATGRHKDRTYRHRSAPIALVVSAPEVVEPAAKVPEAAAVGGSADNLK
jgi:hypothetical protein